MSSVPAGDGAGAAVADTFCGVVGFGSKQLITLKQRPLVLVVAVVLLFLAIRSFVRRTDWDHVDPLPIVRRRRAGQTHAGAVRLYRAHPRRFASVGLIYIPIASLIGASLALIQQIPLVGALLETEENLGLVGLLFAFVFATLAHTIGFVFVRAVVAMLMNGLERGDDTSGSDAYRQAYKRLGDLLAALAERWRSSPRSWSASSGSRGGSVKLVRYQFLAETTTLERARRAGRTRSQHRTRARAVAPHRRCPDRAQHDRVRVRGCCRPASC